MSRFWQSFGFAARMTRRDFRAHAGALAFFSAAVALGVGVMVATDTLAAAIASKLQAEGKSLLGADLELRSRKPFPKEFDARLDALDGTRVHLVRTVETLSMVSGTLPASQARLCSLKAVGPGYPLYGEVLTDPPGAWKELVSRGGVLLAPALAMQLGVRPGESVMAGKSRLPVLGELRAEPDHLAEAFHLGPRMMMRLQDLPATGLLAPGSRGTWRALLRLAPGTDAAALARELAKSAPDGDVEAATAEEGPEGARRLLSRVNGFLGLSGLCVLLLAGVATAMAVHTHLVQRLDSLAIFKCLGATGRGLVTMVLFETLALSTVGALAGAAAGLALARWLPTLLAGVFPFEVDASLDAAVLLRGLALAVLATVGFSAVPVLGLRRLSAARVFRRDVEPAADHGQGGGLWTRGTRSIDRTAWTLAAVLALAVVGLVFQRAGTPELAGRFLAGFAATLGALALAARSVTWVMKRFHPGFGFVGRHGLANLHRPGNQTTSVVVAVGLGVFLLLAVHLLRGAFLDEFEAGLRQSAPNLFVIDIQEDQKAGVERLLAERGFPAQELVPLVRSRLAKVRGVSVSHLHPPGSEAPWWLKRDYWLSYRDHLTPSEQLVDGRFWTGPVRGSPTEVSVEERTSERLEVGPGDSLTLDVQGLEVEARVTNVRRVRWTSLRPNFFLLLPPGVLEPAPKTFFAVVRVPDPRARVELTRQLVDLYANLTVIDLETGAATVRGILERLSWVVLLVAASCGAGGGLLLAAAVLLTRRRRLHEMALLKLLGARRGVLIRILACEYLVLGLVAGAVGSVAAALAARAVAAQLFDLTVQLSAGVLLLSTAGAALFVCVCGALASVGMLGRPPFDSLRSE